ncbi:MAG: ice-binding family protein [Hymenobacter sp.]
MGEVKNAGPTIVNGNIGTNAGAFSGFPPGVINNGNALVATTYTTQAATDVQTAYGYFSANIPCVTPLAIYGGTPAVTPLPGSYCVTGATTLAGTLILDAGGVANAKFYLRVMGGALTTAANSKVVLAGGATADNVYWQISGGAANLGQNSTMQGTMLVDGAISMAEGTTLIGRGLSRAGPFCRLRRPRSLAPSACQPSPPPRGWAPPMAASTRTGTRPQTGRRACLPARWKPLCPPAPRPTPSL